MNGSFLINQVRLCMLPYTSQIAKEVFFQLPFREYHFIIANLVRLNLAVLKISICQRDDQTLYSHRLTALLLLDRMHILMIF